MNIVSLEAQALEKIKNKYLLTILVSKRVNQLKKGKRSSLSSDDIATFYELALREIIEGKMFPKQTKPKPAEVDMDAASHEFQMPSDEDFSDQEPIQEDTD